jgi:uncharacterized membrane protein
MVELIAIGYPEEARACHARDEVNQLITKPDAARAIIRNCEGSIWVATNPYALAVGIIWGMFLGLLVGLIAGTGLGVLVGAGSGPSSPGSTGAGSTGGSRAASGGCSSPAPPCWS